MDAVCLGTASGRLPTVPLSVQGHRYMQANRRRCGTAEAGQTGKPTAQIEPISQNRE